MTIHRTFLAIVIVVSVAGTAAAKDFSWNFRHGADCVPVFEQWARTAYGEPGVGNFSPTLELRVFCPGARTIDRDSNFYAMRVTSGTVSYEDRNRDADFWCYMWVTEPYGGGTWWSDTKHTCSQFYGCPDPTSTYVGRGILSWSDPFYGHKFGRPLIGYSCGIPPVQNGAASWIGGYDVDTWE